MSDFTINILASRNTLTEMDALKTLVNNYAEQLRDVNNSISFEISAKANIKKSLNTNVKNMELIKSHVDSMSNCLKNSLQKYEQSENAIINNDYGKEGNPQNMPSMSLPPIPGNYMSYPFISGLFPANGIALNVVMQGIGALLNQKSHGIFGEYSGQISGDNSLLKFLVGPGLPSTLDASLAYDFSKNHFSIDGKINGSESFYSWGNDNRFLNGQLNVENNNSILDNKFKSYAFINNDNGNLSAELYERRTMSLFKSDNKVTAFNDLYTHTTSATISLYDSDFGIGYYENDKPIIGTIMPFLKDSAFISGESTLKGIQLKDQRIIGTEQYNGHQTNDLCIGKVDSSLSLGSGYLGEDRLGRKTYGVTAQAGAEAYLLEDKLTSGLTVCGIDFDVSLKGKLGGGGVKAGGSITNHDINLDVNGGLGAGLGLTASIDWSDFEMPDFSDLDVFGLFD